MDNNEILAIIGDLYLKICTISVEKDRIDRENEELKKIISALQKNGTANS